MNIEEAIEILNKIKEYTKGACECSLISGSEKIQLNKEVQAIDTVLQELEDTEKANEMELWEIKLRIGLIEEELEVLENYSLNNWQRFGFEKEAVAVKRIRNATNDFRELLKGE